MAKKHILVVGGTKGIGSAVARQFSNEGYSVSVIGRDNKKNGKVQNNTHYWKLDLLELKSIPHVLADIVKRNGKIINLVFCQRYRGQGDDWEGEMKVSLTATKHIIDYFKDKFDGAPQNSIVVIGSGAGSFIAKEQPLSYHISKAGIKQMVRYYATALGPKGIRVNCVSPSTFLKNESKDFYIKNKPLLNLYKAMTPLGRMGTAEEIAEVVSFLCSTKSSFITGQDIVIDGGISLQLHESMARMLCLGSTASGSKNNKKQ